MGLFSANLCDQCRLPLLKAVYIWRFPGRDKMRVCPTCNTKFQREQSRIAFAQNNPFQRPAPKPPPLPGASRSLFRTVKIVALVVFGVLVACIGLGVIGLAMGGASKATAPAEKRVAAATPARTPSPPPVPLVASIPPVAGVTATPSLPAAPTVSSPPTFRTADEAKREAVRRFPSLAVANSTFNSNFVAGYHQIQRDRPADLNDPNWPMTLALKVAAGEVFLEPDTAPAPATVTSTPVPEVPAGASARGNTDSSPGGTWVKSYQRKDGTVVHGHTRK